MAGGKETPERRRQRDEAVTEADERAAAEQADAAEHLTAAAVPAATSNGNGRGNASFTAAATSVRFDDRKAAAAMRRRRQAWHDEACDYVKEIGELGYQVEFMANLMSKLRLFPATRPDPEQGPVPADDPDSGLSAAEAQLCVDVLERLRSPQGGQSAILYGIGWNLEVTGDMYLHGHEVTPGEAEASDGVLAVNEEQWFVRSVRQLVPLDKWFGLRTAAGSSGLAPIPADDYVKRVWAPDPEFDELSTSPVRRVLAICENLLLAQRAMRATLMSHLPAGLLLTPQELSFGSQDPTRGTAAGESADDPFEADMRDMILSPIQEPGSAGSVAPGHVTGPAEYLKPDVFRHLTFARPIDALLVSWIDTLVMRLARGLNSPVEVVTGLQATTFANAAQVKRSEWDSHGEPRATLIVDSLTAGYYREAIVKSGMPPERAALVFVWFDPSACIAAPDPTDSADHGSQEGLIRDEAWRRIRGYSDADAPSDDELLRRLAYAAPRMDPFLAAQLWKKTGMFPDVQIPAPPAGILGPDGQIVGGPAAAGEIAAAVMAEMTAAGRPRKGKGAALGRRLVQIDRDLRLRVQTAAEQALRRALERAGAKIRPKLGRSGPAAEAAAGVPNRLLAAAVGRDVVTAAVQGTLDFGGEFDELADDLGAWVEVAWRQAIDAVAAVYGPIPDARMAELAARRGPAVEAAQDQLKQRMGDLAAARLFDPNPGAAAVGETDVASSVPAYIAREALALAGGDRVQGGDGSPLTSEDGTPVGGVATGPDVMGETGGVEGYVWDYGAAPRVDAHGNSTSFPPHEDLDGVPAVSFDDPAWANPTGWPSDQALPGDHDGCVVPGTWVCGPAPHGTTRRHYAGRVVAVSFGSGARGLTVTPNHPVLTTRGWQPAGDVKLGDTVARCLKWDVWSAALDEDTWGESVEVERVAVEGAERVAPVAPSDFHGDGQAGSATVRNDPTEMHVAESHSFHADRLPETLAKRPDLVMWDEVTAVAVHRYDGEVYNLHTAPLWYLAEGVITGNCVCDIVPTLLDPAEVDSGGGE